MASSQDDIHEGGETYPVCADTNPNNCELCLPNGIISATKYFCQDCAKYLCSQCRRLHEEHPLLKGHDVRAINTGGETIEVCIVHPNERVQYWCQTCRQPLCIVCLLYNHTDHDALNLGAFTTTVKSETDSVRTNVLRTKENQVGSMYLIDKIDTDFTVHSRVTRSEIKKHCTELRKMVSKVEQQLLARLEDTFESERNKIKRELEQGYQNIQQIQNWLEKQVPENLDSCMTISELQNMATEGKNLAKIMNLTIPEIEVLHFSPDIKGEVGTLSKQKMPPMVIKPLCNIELPFCLVNDVMMIGSNMIAILRSICMTFYQLQGSDWVFAFDYKPDDVSHWWVRFVYDSELSEIYVTCNGAKCKTVHVYRLLGRSVSEREQQWPAYKFGCPAGVLLMKSRRVVVSDMDSKRLTAHSVAGDTISDNAVNGTNMFESPRFIASDSADKIIVSDPDKNGVFVFDSDGRLKYKIAGSKKNDGNGNQPQGVCLDSFDNIIVAYSDSNSIIKYDNSGNFVRYLLTGKFADILSPSAISIARKGNKYVICVVDQPALFKPAVKVFEIP